MRALLDHSQVAELRERLARTRWSSVAADGWDMGVPRAWLRELVTAWEAFSVADFQDRLDALSHLTIDVDGQMLHVVHARGQGPRPMPLVLTHGWPGSFCEYLARPDPLIDRPASARRGP